MQIVNELQVRIRSSGSLDVDISKFKSIKDVDVSKFQHKHKTMSDEERFLSHTNKNGENGCWNWTGALYQNGYGVFTYRYRAVKVHRYSYRLYRGQIPEGLEVCHTCDNKKCVNPEHLFLGTQQDNMTDMVNKGRSLTGEKGTNTKLTWEQVREIRKLYKTGKHSQYTLADLFNVSRSNIKFILNNKTWKEV
jgi:hypothetical protein